MRAGFCVQAFVGDAQAFNRAPADEMLLHNRFRVYRAHVAVPDSLRVAHHRGTVFALVQAAGLVDAHPAGKSCFLGQLLQARVQIALSIGGATGPRRVSRARVMADEDVMLKSWQWE